MNKMITRTVFTSIIHAEEVSINNGQFEHIPIQDTVVYGKKISDNATALKEVLKVTKEKLNYVITGIDIEEKVYGVPVDVFMANAQEVIRPESQRRKGDK